MCAERNGDSQLNQELLTPKQAAEYLKISPSTLRRWTRDGQVPYIRIGTGRVKSRTIRYRLEDLRMIQAEVDVPPLERASKQSGGRGRR